MLISVSRFMRRTFKSSRKLSRQGSQGSKCVECKQITDNERNVHSQILLRNVGSSAIK